MRKFTGSMKQGSLLRSRFVAISVYSPALPPTPSTHGEWAGRCQQSLSEASMRFPFGRYLILQGRLADIIDAGVAPAGCMRALQRPWIYRGNGHVISISLYRHGMLQRASHDHPWRNRGRDSLDDAREVVAENNGNASYSWRESGCQARRYSTTAALERVGGSALSPMDSRRAGLPGLV